MIELPDLLNFIVTTLQANPLVQTVRVVETVSFSNEQYSLKIKAQLLSGETLQIRVYQNAAHSDYAYQLYRADKPLLRWDNKEHFPDIPSQPHHFHSLDGSVGKSTLTGNPLNDLPVILDYLKQ